MYVHVQCHVLYSLCHYRFLREGHVPEDSLEAVYIEAEQCKTCYRLQYDWFIHVPWVA